MPAEKSSGDSTEALILEEQRFVDAALVARDERIRSGRETSASAGADAFTNRVIRKMLDADADLLNGLDDDFVKGAIYISGDVDRYLLDSEDVTRIGKRKVGRYHVGLVHLKTKRGILVDWRAELGSTFTSGQPVDGVELVERRTIETAGGQVHSVQREGFGAGSKRAQSDLGRIVRAGLKEVADDKPLARQRAGKLSDPGRLQGEDLLLRDLEASRDGFMREAVATIQADQDQAIRASHDRALIIDGGPGTGKTLVGLHRVAKIMYDLRLGKQAAEVLVVGPSSRFSEYISKILPSLGEKSITVLDFDSLCLSRVDRRRRPESISDEGDPLVARVKGDLGMCQVLRAAAWTHVRPSASRLRVNGVLVMFEEKEIAELVDMARVRFAEHGDSYSSARDLVVHELRKRSNRKAAASESALLEMQRERSEGASGKALRRDRSASPTEEPTARQQAAAASAPTRVIGTGRGEASFEDVAKEWLPDIDPVRLVAELQTSEPLRERVSDGAVTLVLRLLRRDAKSSWTRSDLPLVDEATFILGGPSTRFRHVVVDEAQELSAMAWRVIQRRVTGTSVTLLGDPNQRSSPSAVDGWEAALASLGIDDADSLTLGVSYRVPREILAVANEAFPESTKKRLPRGLRKGGEANLLTCAKRPGAADVTRVLKRLDKTWLVGVIVDDHAIREAIEVSERVVVVRPDEAKGLEFDAVVVVEPADWCDESEESYRRLYVALTRATKKLYVVRHFELPARVERAPWKRT